MKILFASSEVEPFAKTGGLADVAGALPRELAKLGHDVCLFMPAYRSVPESGESIQNTGIRFEVPVGTKIVGGSLLVSQLPGSEVPVYFIDMPKYFGRNQLYGENGVDYDDNCERFVFFSRAVLEAIRLLNLQPDIIHVNDWQTGLIPALLSTEYSAAPIYEDIASLITVHNLAYQGSFWHWDMLLTGIDWKHFNWREMEFHGRLNLLKTGLVFADSINTVSPTYAVEIQTPEQGCGLEGVLQSRNSVLSGILNGIDTDVWNPAKDQYLTLNFNVGSWETGKAANKLALQKQLGFDQRDDVMMIGMVGRLAAQKGWSLIVETMNEWVESADLQWAILGTGQPEYHESLSLLAQQFPNKIGLRLDFLNEHAHLIEAGCDLFLMPSEYEPCGLNQMYSMAYGAVPLVRHTGGLADTVVDATETALRDGTANGFVFAPFELAAFKTALRRATEMFDHERADWKQLVETGMKTDFSWASSAKKYVRLYERTIAQKLSKKQMAN